METARKKKRTGEASQSQQWTFLRARTSAASSKRVLWDNTGGCRGWWTWWTWWTPDTSWTQNTWKKSEFQAFTATKKVQTETPKKKQDQNYLVWLSTNNTPNQTCSFPVGPGIIVGTHPPSLSIVGWDRGIHTRDTSRVKGRSATINRGRLENPRTKWRFTVVRLENHLRYIDLPSMWGQNITGCQDEQKLSSMAPHGKDLN